MSVHAIIHFRAREDQLDAFCHLMDAVKKELPSAPGCRSVAIFRETQQPLAFTLVEHWDSTERHAAHIQRFQDSGGWATLLSYLATPPASAYYTQA